MILCCLWWCAFVAFVEIYNSHSQDDFNRALVCSIIKLGSNLIFSLKQCKCHVVGHVIKCNSVRTVVQCITHDAIVSKTLCLHHCPLPLPIRSQFVHLGYYVERNMKESASADDSHFSKLV